MKHSSLCSWLKQEFCTGGLFKGVLSRETRAMTWFFPWHLFLPIPVEQLFLRIRERLEYLLHTISRAMTWFFPWHLFLPIPVEQRGQPSSNQYKHCFFMSVRGARFADSAVNTIMEMKTALVIGSKCNSCSYFCVFPGTWSHVGIFLYGFCLHHTNTILNQ